MTTHPLKSKTALITGASRGLGAAIASQFARDGATLALVARNGASLESLLPSLRRSAPDASQQFRIYTADLSSTDEIDRLTERILNDFSAIDILVNNAAIQGPIGAFEKNNWPAWQTVFAVNLFAPARLCQRLIPRMRSVGGGKIINLSGGGAASPRPDFSAYAASKTALVRFTETLAEELKPDRIDVNAVAPGAMNGRMLDEVLAAGLAAATREYEAAVSRSRSGGASPDRAAALIAFLASSASDGITGKLISAVWDDWEHFAERKKELMSGDMLTLRRLTVSENQL